MRRLVQKRHGILCLACGAVMVSWYRHDYKTCGCENNTMVDGGSDYTRYGGKNMDLVQTVNVESDEYSEALGRIELSEKELNACLPGKKDIFRAFSYFPLNKTRVVIIGQDPYPTPGHANGLAFSVSRGIKPFPPSLRNIFEELVHDIPAIEFPATGDLSSWAYQGVLLLNTVLTTAPNRTLAHQDRGWEEYTTNVLKRVLGGGQPLVILAWGAKAQDKVYEVKPELHEKALVIRGGHPSPLNRMRTFRGGKYFSKANRWLVKHGVEKIDWRVK